MMVCPEFKLIQKRKQTIISPSKSERLSLIPIAKTDELNNSTRYEQFLSKFVTQFCCFIEQHKTTVRFLYPPTYLE